MSPHFTATLLLISLLAPAATLGTAGEACGFRAVHGFIPIEELAAALPEHAASVSIKFLLKSGEWEGCSGAVVSDQGHIMTAGHCFENCTAIKAKASPTNPYGNYGSYTQGYGSVESERTTAKERPKTCLAMVDGVETTVDVKLTSECSFEEHQMAPAAKPPGKCSRFNEVAIVLPRGKLQQKPCLPVAKEYRIGEEVSTIGYPSRTERGESDSDGKSQYASFGKIIPYSQKCTMIKNAWEYDRIQNIQQPGTVVDFDVFVVPEMKNSAIQTTVDVVPGNSGGPLLNSKGEIIAVGSFGDTQRNNEFKQCKGSSFFSPIAGVSSEVSHFSGDFKMSGLECQKHRVQTLLNR